MEELSPSIVIDYGSNSIKFGLTGDELPHSIVLQDDENPSTFLDDFESNFRKILLDELKVEPEKHPILLTEVPLSKKPQAEQTAQVLFEKFNIPAISIQAPGILALFSSGRVSGLVLDSGFNFTYTLPVCDGKILSDGIEKIEFAGRKLDESLGKMLSLNNVALSKYVKEHLCYVAFDFSKELVSAVDSKTFSISHTLPDGQEIFIGTERFKCPEALFSPKLFDYDIQGLDQMIFKSIAQSNVELQKKLFSNIVLTGGSTSFLGFSERIQKEVSGMSESAMKVKVISPQEKIFSAWIGGTLVATQSTFPEICVTKREFEEFGSKIIREKFVLSGERK